MCIYIYTHDWSYYHWAIIIILIEYIPIFPTLNLSSSQAADHFDSCSLSFQVYCVLFCVVFIYVAFLFKFLFVLFFGVASCSLFVYTHDSRFGVHCGSEKNSRQKMG